VALNPENQSASSILNIWPDAFAREGVVDNISIVVLIMLVAGLVVAAVVWREWGAGIDLTAAQ
jgi:hypothetical protein